jgi:hypothetical protein
MASSRRPHCRYRQWRICHPPIPRDGLSAAKLRWWQLCAAAGSRWRKLCSATNYRRRSSSPGSVRSRRTALPACVPRAFGDTAGRVHRQPPAHEADSTPLFRYVTERTDERWLMAELLRLKGELLLCEAAAGATAAGLSRQLHRARIESEDSPRVMPVRRHLATVR